MSETNNNLDMNKLTDLADAKVLYDDLRGRIEGRANKVANATNGNFAGLDANGNLVDSGKKASDFLTQHQDISGKVDKEAGKGLSTNDYTNEEKLKNANNASAISDLNRALDTKANQTEVDDLSSAFDGITGNGIIEMQKGKAVDLGSSPVDIVPATNSGYNCAVVNCNEGDIFTISANGGNTAKAYAFLDSSKNIISGAISPAWYNANELQLVAPASATYLIINDRSKTKQSYYGRLIKKDVASLESAVQAEKEFEIKGYYTQTTSTGHAVLNNKSAGEMVYVDEPQSASGMASIVIKNIPMGCRFKVFGKSSSGYRYFSWVDKDSKMISAIAAWSESGGEGKIITAPQEDCMLVCSSYADYKYGFSVQYLGAQNYIANEVEKVGYTQKDIDSASIKKSSTKNFLFFSDIHGGDTNYNRIIDFANRNGIDAIINGGDTVQRYLNDNENPFTWYATGITNSSVDILSAVGNHDAWTGAYWTKDTAIDIYNQIIAPLVSKFSDYEQPEGASENGYCYYYKDYDSIRIIVINAMTGISSVEFWDSTQKTWLNSVLADAKTNSKHVIVVNHSPFPKNIAQRDDELNWNSYIDYRTYSGSDGIVMDADALDTIQSFVSNGGKLVCLLTGHEHLDNILTATGYTGQWMINISSAKYSNHIDGITSDDPNSGYYDCYDLISVDATNTLVKVLRIGWHTDASLKIRERLCYNYETGKIISK